MRTVVLTGIRAMEIRDVADPEMRADTDVLLRLAVVGVCGSDIHYYLTGRIGSQVVDYPFPVGHECAAEVQCVGTAVRQLKPGDRVAIDPAVSCHACDQCLAGRPHTCRRLRFLGCPGQLDGCLSDLIVLPQECCYRIADKTTMEQAALAEPLSIGLYSVRQAGPLEKARIAILGAGPIGLSVLLAARCHGVQRVYMTDKIDARLAVARRAGADWTGNPNTTEIVTAIAAHEPLHLDVVFECCGDQAALDQAVGLLKPGGKLMLVGIPAVARVSFAAEQLRHNELILHNVRRQNACVRPALDLIEHDRVDVDHLITHRFPFEQTQDAFDLVAGYRDGVVKAVVHCAP